jgi:chromosome segregation ATPase
VKTAGEIEREEFDRVRNIHLATLGEIDELRAKLEVQDEQWLTLWAEAGRLRASQATLQVALAAAKKERDEFSSIAKRQAVELTATRAVLAAAEKERDAYRRGRDVWADRLGKANEGLRRAREWLKSEELWTTAGRAGSVEDWMENHMIECRKAFATWCEENPSCI